jgi:hypothetical protein
MKVKLTRNGEGAAPKLPHLHRLAIEFQSNFDKLSKILWEDKEPLPISDKFRHQFPKKYSSNFVN